jgi:hypothetical protein
MKYLCLVYHDAAALDALTERERAALTCETRAYRAELQRSGRHVAAGALQPARAAVTVRVRDGRLSVSDGPLVGTREQLGGFCLIDARDLNDAIRLAAGMPPARLGWIEVRPLLEGNGCYVGLAHDP